MSEMTMARELVRVAKELVGAGEIQAMGNWMTVEDVREICPACADKMVSCGLTRVREGVVASLKTAGRVWITKLISPTGQEFWEAYGPMVRDRSRATEFSNSKAAERAALGRFGRAGSAFWESERQHESSAYKQYQDWTYEVEEVEASLKQASDPYLDAVVRAIAGKGFLMLREPLTHLGIGKVDMYEGEQMHWEIRTKRGKTIVVVHKSGADVGPNDIMVGDLLVGYL